MKRKILLNDHTYSVCENSTECKQEVKRFCYGNQQQQLHQEKQLKRKKNTMETIYNNSIIKLLQTIINSEFRYDDNDDDGKLKKNDCIEFDGEIFDILQNYKISFGREWKNRNNEKRTTTDDKNIIERFRRYFESFNPINDNNENISAIDDETFYSTLRESGMNVDESNHTLEMALIFSYMNKPFFTRDNILKTIKYDDITNSIVSVLLRWSDKQLFQFEMQYGDVGLLAKFVRLERTKISPRNKLRQLFVHKQFNNLLFIRTTMIIMKNYFEAIQCSSGVYNNKSLSSSPTPFNIFNFVDEKFLQHLKCVYNYLKLNNTKMEHCTEEYLKFKKSVELEQPSIFDARLKYLFDDKPDALYAFKTDPHTMNIITGQACCGKTTLLAKFKNYGYQSFNRGSMGTFGGKAKEPAVVAALHGCIQVVLSSWSTSQSTDDRVQCYQTKVIGDRGHIDNLLWRIIMHFMSSEYDNDDNLIEKILQSFNYVLCDATILFFFKQNVMVFIDLKPFVNLERLRERGTNNDPQRSRIKNYALIQAICYYIAARLFGWRVFCVPYNVETGIFDPSQYNEIFFIIKEIFDRTILKCHPIIHIPKLDEIKTANIEEGFNFDYADSIGILK